MKPVNRKTYVKALVGTNRNGDISMLVVVGGEYLGCLFNRHVLVPHLGPRGLAYVYSRSEAEALAAALGGTVEESPFAWRPGKTCR